MPSTLTRITGLTGPIYNNCDPIITSLREFFMNKIKSLEHLKEPFQYIVHENISDLIVIAEVLASNTPNSIQFFLIKIKMRVNSKNFSGKEKLSKK